MKLLFSVLFAISLRLVGAAKVKPKAEDFRVKGLEDAYPVFGSFKGDMHAGTLPIDPIDGDIDEENGGHLMFWHFARSDPGPTVDDSLVIWFNGGPGCSSFHAGLMLEFGDVIATPHEAGYFGGPAAKDTPLQENPFAWSKATDVMFIEQPVGIGYSYGGTYPDNEEDVGRDIHGFLQNFYDTFPGTRDKRLFLVGESYAGRYILGMAHYIHQQNKKLRTRDADRQINLQGIGLGNGWIDASVQGPMIIDYAWWHGMIDSVTRDAFHEEWENCYNPDEDFWTKKQPDPFHSFTTPDECGLMAAVLEAAGAGLFPWGAPNGYDVTTWDPYALLTYDNSTGVRFFNDPRVRAALNAPDKVWRGCIEGAGRRRRRLQSDIGLLDHSEPVSLNSYITDLLDDAQIDVLIYNGDRDLTTCVQGSEVLLNSVEWSGAEDWLDPHQYRRGVWLVDDYPAGYSKTVKNLNFLMVYNSGHLVPMNVPKAGLDLITRLLEGKSFIDKDIPIVVESTKSAKTAQKNQKAKTKPKEKHHWLRNILIFASGYVLALFVAQLQEKRRSGYNPIIESTAV